jgi:hypothetical protein
MTRLSAALLILALAASPLAACPHCPTNLGPTLAEQLAAADVAVFVTWQRGDKGSIEEGRPGTTTFLITSIHHDKTSRLVRGQRIALNRYWNGAKGSPFLMLGVADTRVDWSDPITISPAAEEYIRNAPAVDRPPTERLAYYLQFLDHSDPAVSADAFGEFAVAPYSDVAAVAQGLTAQKVRGWLEDPNVDVTRLGFYGLLLGLVGGPDDAEYLKQRIIQPTTEFRLGIDGMISGYLLLTGEAGLDVIDETKLEDPNVEFSETFAAMNSLRFLWSDAPDRIPPERLRESMRILLDRRELTDLVVVDLARWQDWSVSDHLMELYDHPDYDVPEIKRAIIRFYLVESRLKPDPETGKRPPHALQAAAHLDDIRARDPELIKQAERFFFLN